MDILLILMMLSEQKVVYYFREKNAISEKTAIEFDFSKFNSQGNLARPKIGYIVKTDKGLFYLDENKYKEIHDRFRKIGLALAIIVALILILTVITSI